MPWYHFQWTDYRLEKVRLNGIDPDDVEAIISNPDFETVSRSSGLPAAIGVNSDGDEIICIYDLDEDGITVFPITAYFMRDEK